MALGVCASAEGQRFPCLIPAGSSPDHSHMRTCMVTRAQAGEKSSQYPHPKATVDSWDGHPCSLQTIGIFGKSPRACSKHVAEAEPRAMDPGLQTTAAFQIGGSRHISILRSLWDRQHNKLPHKSGLVIEVSFVQGPIGIDMTVSLHLYHLCFSLTKHNCTSPFPIFYTSRSLLITKIVRFIGVFIEPI